MLWSTAFLLMELKAFSASTKSTASVSSIWNKSHIAWMAARVLTFWPTHTCKDPGLLDIFLCNIHLNFPAISWTTPIGPVPGFLFWGIRFAMNALRVSPTRFIDVFKFLVQSVLMKLAKYFWRSKEEDTNDVDTKILCQFSATNPDGPHPPIVFNVSLNASVSSIASQTTGWTCFIDHCSRTS